MASPIELSKFGRPLGDLRQVAEFALDAVGTLGGVSDPFRDEPQSLQNGFHQYRDVRIGRQFYLQRVRNVLATRLHHLLGGSDRERRVRIVTRTVWFGSAVNQRGQGRRLAEPPSRPSTLGNHPLDMLFGRAITRTIVAAPAHI